ncbi:MAG: hypothetical protein IIA06_12270 [Proteobacteria bacterium]|nr:hypothetical protein [Pseudomonadota bacterium]
MDIHISKSDINTPNLDGSGNYSESVMITHGSIVSFDQLFYETDRALYSAGKNGRNRVQFQSSYKYSITGQVY